MSFFGAQTKLPYVRDVNYLSPSSFMTLEADPATFYLRKLGPEEFKPPYGPQTVSMAVGSAFDSSVKGLIAERSRLECPSYAQLIANTVEVPLEPWGDPADQHAQFPATPEHRERLLGDSPWEHSVKMGHQLCAAYDALGLIDDEVWTGVEIHTDVGHVPKVKGVNSLDIPIFGQLDAKIAGRKHDEVFDWKVAGGALPNTTPSPNPGYTRLYDFNPDPKRGKPHVGLVKNGEPHPKAALPMHLWGGWGPKWAVQLTMYTWLDREIENVEPIRVALDQLICHPGGRVRVAQYRTTISVGWQISLIRRFVEAWTAIQEETLVSFAASIEELQVSPRVSWW